MLKNLSKKLSFRRYWMTVDLIKVDIYCYYLFQIGKN